jgi:hypothetical protein
VFSAGAALTGEKKPSNGKGPMNLPMANGKAPTGTVVIGVDVAASMIETV